MMVQNYKFEIIFCIIYEKDHRNNACAGTSIINSRKANFATTTAFHNRQYVNI